MSKYIESIVLQCKIWVFLSTWKKKLKTEKSIKLLDTLKWKKELMIMEHIGPNGSPQRSYSSGLEESAMDRVCIVYWIAIKLTKSNWTCLNMLISAVSNVRICFVACVSLCHTHASTHQPNTWAHKLCLFLFECACSCLNCNYNKTNKSKNKSN